MKGEHGVRDVPARIMTAELAPRSEPDLARWLNFQTLGELRVNASRQKPEPDPGGVGPALELTDQLLVRAGFEQVREAIEDSAPAPDLRAPVGQVNEDRCRPVDRDTPRRSPQTRSSPPSPPRVTGVPYSSLPGVRREL